VLRVLQAAGAVLRLAFLPFQQLAAWQAAAVVVVGGATAAAFAWLVDGRAGVVAGVAALALLLLVAGIRLQLRLEPESRVRFVWLGGYSARGVFRVSYLSTGRKELTKTNEELDFVGVEVSNAPGPADAAVQDAVVELDFFLDGEGPAREDERPVLNSDGRWTFNAQATTRGPFDEISDLKRRTLPSNGERHRIDVAMKFRGEADFYAASLRWSTISGYRDERLKLTDEAYRVRVSVAGVGMREPTVGWFRIKNLGPRVGLDIEPVSPWKTEPIPGLPSRPSLT
jgi:hypothetical protein